METLLPKIADFMQIVTGASVLALTIIVFFHQRRNDKEAVRARAWDTQQKLNMSIIQDQQILRATEYLISGRIKEITHQDELEKAIYVAFLQINRTYFLWTASRSNLISEKELLDEVNPTLRLYSGAPDVINYCLTRGYSAEFINFIREKQHRFSNENHESILSISTFAKRLLNST